MTITAEDLRTEIENLKRQRQEAADLFQQATGALMLAQAMLAREESENRTMSVSQFAEAIGGNGAVATIEEL